MNKMYRLLWLIAILLNISISFIHLKASQECPTPLPATDLIRLIVQSKSILESRLGTPMQPDAGIMQSVIIPKTSKLVFVGDLHGDVVSLVNNINRMKGDGVFTSQTKRERDGGSSGTLRLHDDYYLIFTGDYTDRGYHGIEVWQILLQLLINNPGKVFLLKGNHDQPESINNPWDFVFKKEIALKYPNDHARVFEGFTALWNLLPQALFIGTSYQKTGSYDFHYRYMLCCHGALEPLLIGKVRELLNTTTQMPESNINTSLFNDTDFKISSDFPFFKQLTDLLKPTPPTAQNNGFIWYDIHNKNEPEQSRRGPGSILYNPAPYLNTFLHNQKITGTNKRWSIDAIMRGHEHQYKSVTRISQTGPQILMDERSMPVTNNDVFTFISSPEGVLTHYDAYAIVTLNQYPWILTPKIRSIPPLSQFCSRCTNNSNSLKTAITETALSFISWEKHEGKVPWQDIRLLIMTNPNDTKIDSLKTDYPLLCWSAIMSIASEQRTKYEAMLKDIIDSNKIPYMDNPPFPRVPALVNLKNYTFEELRTIQEAVSTLAKDNPTYQEELLDIKDNFIRPAFINRAHAAWAYLKSQLSLDETLELSNLNKIKLRDWYIIKRSGQHVLEKDWNYFYNTYLSRIKSAVDQTSKKALVHFITQLKRRTDLNLPNLIDNDISSLQRLTKSEVEQLIEQGQTILRGDWDYIRETYIEPLLKRYS